MDSKPNAFDPAIMTNNIDKDALTAIGNISSEQECFDRAPEESSLAHQPNASHTKTNYITWSGKIKATYVWIWPKTLVSH